MGEDLVHQPDLFKQLLRCFFGFRPRNSLYLNRAQDYVFKHVHVGKKIEMLEYHPHAPAVSTSLRASIRFVVILLSNQIFPAVGSSRRLGSGGRCFFRSPRSDYYDDFSLFDSVRYAAENVELAEFLCMLLL